MVGEGVLYECLLNEQVESVLVINRRPCNFEHPKLKEIIHDNFHDFSSIKDQLVGYNAGFFCMGVSSVGMKADLYYKITYEITMQLATLLANINPSMSICYVSGVGTDSSEKGRSKWARVKGKTENDLMQLPFKGAFMFRPGYIQPIKGLKNTYTLYRILAPLYPLWKLLFPNYVSTLKEIGQAMINVVLSGYEKHVIEVKDIKILAKNK